MIGKLSLLAELQRRNVYRAAVLYAAGAWLAVQVATQVFPFFHIAEWVVRWIVVAAILGFPFRIAFAWFFEFTADPGRDRGRRREATQGRAGAALKARTTDPEAYALYLQAVQLGRRRNAEAVQQSEALYRKVLAIDPCWAQAWVGGEGPLFANGTRRRTYRAATATATPLSSTLRTNAAYLARVRS